MHTLIAECVRSPSEIFQKVTDYKFLRGAVWKGVVNVSYYGLIAYYLSGRGRSCARIPNESPKYAAVIYGAVPVISSIACSVIFKSGFLPVVRNGYLCFRVNFNVQNTLVSQYYPMANQFLFQQDKAELQIEEFKKEWSKNKARVVVKTFVPLSVNIAAGLALSYFAKSYVQKQYFADVEIKGSWGVINSLLVAAPWELVEGCFTKVVFGNSYRKYSKFTTQISTVALATYIFRKNISSVLSSLQKVSVYAWSTNR